MVAFPTALAKDNGVVPIVREPPDQYCHLLTTPATVGAAAVIALKTPHDMSRVPLVGSAVLVAEPCVGDIVRDGFQDVFMQGWKRVSRLLVVLPLRALFRHFCLSLRNSGDDSDMI